MEIDGGKKNEVEEAPIEGLKGTRLSTFMMLVLWVGAIVFRTIDMNWTRVNCYTEFNDDGTDNLCVRYNSIYRGASIAIAIMLVQGLLSVLSMKLYDDYWFIKFILFVGCTAALLLLDSDAFDDDGFVWVARIGAFIFIILQASILLDFAYYWNQSWIDKSGMFGGAKGFVVESTDCYQGCKSIWLCGLMIMSLIYCIIFVCTMGVLYHFYGGKGCHDNVNIITVSLILVLAAITVQLIGQNGSIIASGIVAVYVSYLTYVAVSLNPDEQCNPSVGNQHLYGIGQFIIGIVICFISILWVSVITSRRIAGLLGNYSNLGVLSVVQGRYSGTKNENAEEQLEKHTHLAVLNLSFVCILICFYISMILTNWGTIAKETDTTHPTAGTTSMWMQALAAWVAIGLYIVGLIIPSFKILPDSIWELKFNFSGLPQEK